MGAKHEDVLGCGCVTRPRRVIPITGTVDHCGGVCTLRAR